MYRLERVFTEEGARFTDGAVNRFRVTVRLGVDACIRVVPSDRLVVILFALGLTKGRAVDVEREAGALDTERGALDRAGVIREGAVRLAVGALRLIDRLAAGALRLIDRLDRLAAGARLAILGARLLRAAAGRLVRAALALPTLARLDVRLD